MKKHFLCFLPVFIVGLALSIGYNVHSKNKTSDLALLNAEAIANEESSGRKGPATPSTCPRLIQYENSEDWHPCQTFITKCWNEEEDTGCSEVMCSRHSSKE